MEYEPGRILHLRDTEYNLNKTFPCLEFEIYEESYFKLLGRRLNPLSVKIKPVLIDRKAKWNYLEKYGAPGKLETLEIGFEELLVKFNSADIKDHIELKA